MWTAILVPMISLAKAVRSASGLLFGAVLVLAAPPAGAYSLLTHEQLIDLTWQSSIAPLLERRFPGSTPQQIEEARSYAYGGCVIQDIGYYPFGDAFFSELTHYVRSGDFIVNLFRDARDPNELAFAIGALSHYIGDTIGHADATNVAVPVEFPKLEAKYGHIVTYAEGEHAHVQTEFAFDINEIAHHRLAPLRYLRQVGLNVPTRQLATAFYQTYGLGEDFSRRRTRRVNVEGYRFAVRALIPGIAYALTALHRHRMPDDAPTDDFRKMEAEFARVATEENWDQYRRKPGFFTYSLAGLIFLLPKIGPLRLLAIKGPREATELQYVRSVNRSTDTLRLALSRLGGPRQGLENRDLDTGAVVRPGGYRLTDVAYARLLHRLVAEPSVAIPAGVKANVLRYYADPDAPIVTRNDAAKWGQVQSDLKVLQTMKTGDQPLDTETE